MARALDLQPVARPLARAIDGEYVLGLLFLVPGYFQDLGGAGQDALFCVPGGGQGLHLVEIVLEGLILCVGGVLSCPEGVLGREAVLLDEPLLLLPGLEHHRGGVLGLDLDCHGTDSTPGMGGYVIHKSSAPAPTLQTQMPSGASRWCTIPTASRARMPETP